MLSLRRNISSCIYFHFRKLINFHGIRIRQGMYCVVDNGYPMAKEYEIVKDKKVF